MTVPALITAASTLIPFFFGKGREQKTVPTYLPEQNQVLDLITGQVGQTLPSAFNSLNSILSNDSTAIDTYLKPYRTSLYDYGLPRVYEQLGMLGGEGVENSSGFQNAIGRTIGDYEDRIQAQRIALQQSALQNLQGFFPQVFAPRQYEYVQPRESGLLENILLLLAANTKLGLNFKSGAKTDVTDTGTTTGSTA